jgi:6-pyruvoyl-tetrahydropterin synthase
MQLLRQTANLLQKHDLAAFARIHGHDYIAKLSILSTLSYGNPIIPRVVLVDLNLLKIPLFH